MKKIEKKPQVKSLFSFSLVGYATIKIDGFNQIKLLNALKNEQISVKSVVKRAQNDMDITLKRKDCEKTFAICKRMCYNYSVEVYRGLLPCIKTRLKRVGVVVGVTLATIVAVVCSSLVTKVTVVSENAVLTTAVEKALADSGIKSGNLVSKVNRDEVESVVLAVDGVADCSVSIDGTRLKVVVTKRKDEKPSASNATAITATHYATVTKVVCRSGTATVKSGDRVKQGDLLIKGELLDANGETILSVPADGEVYGIISEHRKYIASTTAIEYALTGKRKTRTVLSLFGLKIGKNESPFENYESVTEKAKFSAFLPIKVTQTTYYESKKVNKLLTVDQLIESATKRARKEVLCGESATVKCNAVEVAQGLYEISVYLEREGIISKEQ